MLESKEIIGWTRWQKMKVDEISHRQILTWEQHSITCSNSLSSHGTKTTQNKPTGTANWHLGFCSGQLSPRIPPGIPRQAQRAIHQLRLNRLTSTASYQAFVGQIFSPICPHCGSGEETAEHLLLYCPKWAAERQQYFGNSISIPDVFQDGDNLVEFFIYSGHLLPSYRQRLTGWLCQQQQQDK